jgi:hypothetical protein
MANAPLAAPQAPSNDTQSALAGAFVALLSNNNAIVLSPQFPTTQIQGLQTANQTLATAVAHANSWNSTISADVQNELQKIVDFNSTYNALVKPIGDQITALGKTPEDQPLPSDTLSNLSSAIQALQLEVQQALYGAGGTATLPAAGSSVATYNELVQYSKDVAADESVFAGLMSIASSTSSGIPAQITNYQNAITADNDAINKDSAMIAGGAAMVVTGILICVIAVAIAPETAGTSVAVVGAIGIATIGGGAAMIGVASTNLDKMNSDIAVYLQDITVDQQELSLLTTVSTIAGNLTQHTKNIVQAMATVLTNWQQLDNAMGAIVTALNLPQQDLMAWVKDQAQQPDTTPSNFMMATILSALMVAPQDDWQTASSTASTILNNLKNVLLFQLPDNTVPTQANIAAAALAHQQVA